MSQVKKQYEELFAIMQAALEAKPNCQLKSVMPQLLELMQAKTGGGQGSTFKRDEDGNVTHVFCYYHKEWEDISEVEYGVKKNTATGLNTMCKEGVSNWSKQQRTYNKKKDSLLVAISTGEVSADELPAKLAELDEERKVIIPRAN